MSRPKMKSILALLTLSITIATVQSSGYGTDWDVSPADRADYYPSGHLAPLRFDDAPFIVRAKTLRKHGPRVPSPINGYGLDFNGRTRYDRIRRRRDLASPDADLEKIAGSKNVREARMNSPESWSKQPLAVQFRQRSGHDQPMLGDAYDDVPDSAEAANLPPLIRAHYAPKTDFVTSGRGRAVAAPPPPPPPPPPEGRESREMPMSRSYDEYDVPVFRNIVREHDFDVQIPRNYYYPNRYRSQRDYYYRGAGGSPYAYDRYRDEEEDYELYGRYRPTPKPKRIIYYATLPEIVRKPVDVSRNNYPRPYDPLVRAPEAQLEPERTRLATSSAAEPSRRPLRYPYDNYDNYVKRSSYYDRRRPSFAADEEDRQRDLERGRMSYKDKMRSDDRKLESQMVRGDDRRLPWPVQIGTEVNVKENERIPGRKIFGQIQGYERYEGSRIKKTSGNADRKEDSSDNNKNNSSNNNDSISNN